ncbi:tRNA lysidine(34) synthetase TilS [Plasticicumulans acidivorans]|uniref:tRNA(Ile)-lysidine synthase n=1 Tax=Plasticicumulans acidivorans TaxID=886464 RepID=A0A317MXG1_9GAMM|nr:tRNA lysidine(34) synthetase TilS [Plasticicumulans acidivorans]PWV63499.1 tRNA(Ile)-lysidine synthase [Plasticicumulans acidivorans]
MIERGGLERLLAAHPQVRRLRVAFSGGLDSSVLLHWLQGLALSGYMLDAVHVDHGWRAESADWARHCVRAAAALGVDCQVIAVNGRPAPGESPEAAARSARYAALAATLDAGSALLCAQHADDQAETLLLQLLRGAGPKGLAGMAADAALGAGRLWRPLLETPRARLRAYAEQQGLLWLEDPANADPAYERSWLRQEIMPRLAVRYPALTRTLGRSARLCAQAAAAEEALAAADLAPLREGDTLRVDGLLALPAARRDAAVRGWLLERSLPLPSAAQLGALPELLTAGDDRAPCLRWPGAQLQRYRGRLHAFAPLPALAAGSVIVWPEPAQPLCLPDGSRLELRPVHGAGIAAARLHGQPLTVRYRRDGERFHPAGRRHAQTLKKLLQEAGIAPWLRSRLPLLMAGEQLVAVAGLGIACDWTAAADAAGYALAWQSQAASATMPRFV